MFRKKLTPPPAPTWMIVGLGNPGPEYRGTRHNIGFAVVDRLAESHRLNVSTGKQRALVGQGNIDGTPVALVKPLTYMNLSGQAVAPLARNYGLDAERVLVVSDDLDLPLGVLRLRDSGGSGGHNGHKSIQAALGTQAYPRLRIGIGRSDDDTVDHVLSSFTPEERPIAERAIESACRVLEQVVSGKWSDALYAVERHNKG